MSWFRRNRNTLNIEIDGHGEFLITFPYEWNVTLKKSFISPESIPQLLIKYHDITVSALLDYYCIMSLDKGNPYWEIYPVDGRFTARCDMKDTDSLFKYIWQSINEQNKKIEGIHVAF
ncbi:MAG: hypothetical protein AABY32_01685 [Nanoarchaeota archaeon]